MDVPKRKQITGVEREKLGNELVALYEQGASIKALAEQSGRSYGFVHRILNERGVLRKSTLSPMRPSDKAGRTRRMYWLQQMAQRKGIAVAIRISREKGHHCHVSLRAFQLAVNNVSLGRALDLVDSYPPNPLVKGAIVITAPVRPSDIPSTVPLMVRRVIRAAAKIEVAASRAFPWGELHSGILTIYSHKQSDQEVAGVATTLQGDGMFAIVDALRRLTMDKRPPTLPLGTSYQGASVFSEGVSLPAGVRPATDDPQACRTVTASMASGWRFILMRLRSKPDDVLVQLYAPGEPGSDDELTTAVHDVNARLKERYRA